MTHDPASRPMYIKVMLHETIRNDNFHDEPQAVKFLSRNLIS